MAWNIDDKGKEWIMSKAKERDEAILRKVGQNSKPDEAVFAAFEYDMNEAPRTTQRKMLECIGFHFNDDPRDAGEAEAAVRDCADALAYLGVKFDVDAAFATGASPIDVHSATRRFLEEQVIETVSSVMSRFEEYVSLNVENLHG
jgi:hypothetical protein